MSWQGSVDRVLAMRRAARAEADRAELIRIIQELEKRCQVVVNREVSAVLKDVPSWKQMRCCAGEWARSEYPGKPQRFIHTTDCNGEKEVDPRKVPRFRGGIRTWAEQRRALEKAARAGTDKLKRRTKEFEQVLSGRFGTEDVAGVREEPAGIQDRSGFHAGQRPAQKDEEKSDVESAST